MFYSDFGVHCYHTRIHASHWLMLFAMHFDCYVNGRMVRSVGYDEIVWC